MSGDYSRQRFDPNLDFSGVLMQQGRVQLDADWNELIDLLDRRWRTETTDIIGRGTVPKETPDGFRIQIAGGVMTIGRGRIYVHGLLAENHGKPPMEFDPVLAEQRGTAAVPYAEQPYFPDAATVAPVPQDGGPHLVYLDVWQREVTYLQRSDLIEQAVGVDTTARYQTVWQVRVLPRVGADATCAAPDDQITGWTDLTRPSAGRLTTAAVGVPSTQDPCLIPPSGGYRGLENRLYRVEIHDRGTQGTATFKWSRDNGSIATNVTAITALDKLTVVRTGRDGVLRFNTGDWVEIIDDGREFAQEPGLIRQVQNVDDATRIITLTTPLPAGTFPTTPQGQTDPARHTRVVRWDQQGEVRDTNGNLIVNLNAPGSAGVIPVPAAGVSTILEDGVQITFDVDPAGGQYRAGDYWTFAARTADASVEVLTKAPPRGIHHHYCRLALVTFPGTVTDCRVLWPPDFTGEGCDCSVCVTADSHNNGTLTIHHAIDQVKAIGGTVCLGPGIYNLGESPVRITGAQSIRVKGQGWRTVLAYTGRGSAVAVEGTFGATLEEFAVLTAASPGEVNPAVAMRNCAGVTVQRCYILRLGSTERGSAAIGLGGVLVNTVLRENVLFATVGIGNMPGNEVVTGAAALSLLTANLCVQDTTFSCRQRGISVLGTSFHTMETRFEGNVFNECSQGGIIDLGWVAPGGALNVDGNVLRAAGPGIIIGADGARISHNDISALQTRHNGAGITLTTGLDRTGLDRCQIVGNRIIGLGGHGISILSTVRSAMIKLNVIEGVGGGGIVMDEKSSAESLSIDNNHLLNIAVQSNDVQESPVGIRLVHAATAAVTNNTVHGVGQAAVQSGDRAGIQIVASSSVRVAGNEVLEVGPAGDFVNDAAGIEFLGSFDRADVAENRVRRSRTVPSPPGFSRWVALRVQRPFQRPGGIRDRIRFVELAGVSLVFLGSRLLALPRGREMVGVHGNLLEAYGESPAVVVGTLGALTFSHNRCVLASARQLVGALSGGAVIASANYLEGPRSVPALGIQVGDNAPFTVLGNITSGPIQVNGATLGAPWAALNVVAP